MRLLMFAESVQADRCKVCGQKKLPVVGGGFRLRN